MKKKVILRRLDQLGRIVIPKDIRSKFEINEKDPLEIFVERNEIILKKYVPSCAFCNNTRNLVEFKSKLVCEECRKKIGNLLSQDFIK